MVAIRVENLGKRYRLGMTHAGSIRELVSRATAKLLQRGEARPLNADPGHAADSQGRFWAFRGASFEVEPGEVVGIVGRNGAGKSTLLKLLTRITAPTEGRIELYGRVGSLLEVGTGFHPELSGRENIFLNGAILGMTKAEIRRKLDEIVAFSEIESFLETPVKRYSSGMYVRLAFAVAAHLEPEILLVDEVLAVGDAQFQRKCLGKMRDVSREGRTVLFVSHNMDAVRRLCTRGVWLERGGVQWQGTAEECVARYLCQDLREGGRVQFEPPRALANGMPAELLAVQVTGENGRVQERFSAAEPVRVRIDWRLTQRLYKPRIGFILHAADGAEVFTALDASSFDCQWLEPGRYASECEIPPHLLNEGSYVLNLSGDAPGQHDFTRGLTGGVLQFEVVDDMTLPNKYYGQEGFRDYRWPGVILPAIPWQQHRLD